MLTGTVWSQCVCLSVYRQIRDAIELFMHGRAMCQFNRQADKPFQMLPTTSFSLFPTVQEALVGEVALISRAVWTLSAPSCRRARCSTLAPAFFSNLFKQAKVSAAKLLALMFVTSSDWVLCGHIRSRRTIFVLTLWAFLYYQIISG